MRLQIFTFCVGQSRIKFEDFITKVISVIEWIAKLVNLLKNTAGLWLVDCWQSEPAAQWSRCASINQNLCGVSSLSSCALHQQPLLLPTSATVQII